MTVQVICAWCDDSIIGFEVDRNKAVLFAVVHHRDVHDNKLGWQSIGRDVQLQEAPVELPDVSGIACPQCKEKALVIEERFEAKPLGSYSIAGAQDKLVGAMWPWLRCASCGVEGRGSFQ